MKSLTIPAAVSRDRGMSLIEIMVTIAILGILTAVAIPYFSEMVASQRVRSASSDAYSALLFTRSEAMKRNTTVSLTANDADDWTQGWKVTISGTDVLNQNALGNGLVAEGPNTGNISFLWTGRSSSANAQIKVYSSSHSVQARCVTLSLSGMPQNKLC